MQDSIYYYKSSDFRAFIQTITDKTVAVPDVLATFREVRCLPKKFIQMTVQELSDKTSLIQEVFRALRAGMQPESKFKLPYKKESREQELIENIAENYKIDTKKAKAKVITQHYKDEEGREFNYALEVVIAPRTDIGSEHAGEVEFIGNINDTPSIDGGEKYFQSPHSDFLYKDKKSGREIPASSIKSVLHECGYNTSHYVNTSKKKVPSVVYVNLKTPIPEWLGGAGKTNIDLKPYAPDIAKTVSSIAYQMPSYHGHGFGTTTDSYGRSYTDIAQGYLDDFLKQRKQDIDADPSLKFNDRITQSGVWYRIRPLMIEAGFTPQKDWGTTRKTITGGINKTCDDLFGLKREDLGIIASARAIMYYRGQSYPVNIDNIEELAGKGIAIIVIEKEGIADLLATHADKHRVALVHTKGRFTEYGKDLIDAATSPLGILTDYDAVGIAIAEGTRNETPRIGITIDTIEWLQENGYPDLTQEDVEEEYTPNIYTDDEYLKHHRIELDSIAAKVGAEGLWKYVMHRLHLIAPEGFDFNNVIDQPASEIFYPEAVANLLSKLSAYVDGVVEEEWENIQTELEGVKELIDVAEKEKAIEDRLNKVVEEDEGMKQIVSKAEEVLQELSDLFG
jgi:hypothetical protein